MKLTDPISAAAGGVNGGEFKSKESEKGIYERHQINSLFFSDSLLFVIYGGKRGFFPLSLSPPS